jgi:polar amino acid transport system substrate-binding protein
MIFCLLFWLPGFSFATTPDSQPVTLDVCLIDDELFPLWRKPGAEHKPVGGINIDLMRYIARQLSFRIHWVRAPFPRCLKLLESGQVDALNVASYHANRHQYGLYPFKQGKIDTTRRFKIDSYAAFVQKDSNIHFNGNTFTNIAQQSVAIEIGASVQQRLEEMNLNILPLPNVEQAFNMLLAGRVSMVVTNSHNDKKVQNSDIRKLTPDVVNKPYYLMLSRQFHQQHPELASDIWQVSGKMQNDYYHQIIHYYSGIESWPDTNSD